MKGGETASKSDDAGEDDAGATGPSKGEGTGEKWVKSTGLAAEGGTFDAAAPGAGREADREFFFPSDVCLTGDWIRADNIGHRSSRREGNPPYCAGRTY
jgi:hypothetical protein